MSILTTAVDRATVGRPAPHFDLPCTLAPGWTQHRVSLADYDNRWLVLVFYPRDFSLVCPTELTALSARMDEFRRRGCDLLGVSTDSVESHERWIAAPISQRGLGGLQFPLASDQDGSVSRAYGIYLEQQHIALRGLFIIDPNGILQYQVVHNLSVGRRSEEVLRVLAALESGGMCPEDWCVECSIIDPTRALGPGSVIANYRIEALVGEGTFGTVYRAVDPVLERTVAVKVFKPNRPAAARAALAEARVAAALNHPNICTVFAADDSEGVPLIAMEYLPGKPLSSLLNDGPLEIQRTVRIARQIALAMEVAHQMGIAHGDLKPANIMLLEGDVVKITDFGLARRTARNEDPLGATLDWTRLDDGSVTGTPGYMAPEQTLGQSCSSASDVFSLGIILYEMTTGRRAFAGDNILQLLDQTRRVDGARLAADVPPPFAAILHRALAADPVKRDITMAEIGKKLDVVP